MDCDQCHNGNDRSQRYRVVDVIFRNESHDDQGRLTSAAFFNGLTKAGAKRKNRVQSPEPSRLATDFRLSWAFAWVSTNDNHVTPKQVAIVEKEGETAI